MSGNGALNNGPAVVRAVGFDPGSHCTGWGVVEMCGRRMRGIAAGVVRVHKRDALADRLHAIHTHVAEVLTDYGPHIAVVEDIFFAKYPASALKLGHARGVVLLAAAQAQLQVIALAPALVKRTVTGKGAAPKSQVGRMVSAMLGWQRVPEEDAADALAVAIAHLQHAASPLSHASSDGKAAGRRQSRSEPRRQPAPWNGRSKSAFR